MYLRFKYLPIVALLSYSCVQPARGPVCTNEARAGIVISVRNEKTNAALLDSVSATISSGTYTEELETFGGKDSLFAGAWERPGNYTLTVSHNRYKPTVPVSLSVQGDQCHVTTTSLVIKLLPK